MNVNQDAKEPTTPLCDRVTTQINVISPTHIGTREGRLTALEFVVNQGRVHLIDEGKFGRFLKERNLIDHFVREAKSGPVRMETFLKETARITLPGDLQRVGSYSIAGGEPGMQEFRPFIRDGMGRIYIPGSSIKGVARTAVLYSILKNNPSALDRVKSKVEGSLNYIGKSKKFFSAQWLQEHELQSFTLPKGKPGPNEDLFRCLKVRDAYPEGEVKMQVIRVNFLSKSADGKHYWSQQKRGGAGKDLVVWVEAVTSGCFSAEFIWDKSLFSTFQKQDSSRTFPISGIGSILSAIAEMNHDLQDLEKGFYSKPAAKIPPGTHYKEMLRYIDVSPSNGPGAAATSLNQWYTTAHENPFRIGFGSGMLSTTVNLALPEQLRQKIRDACGSGPRPGDPAPKSRRIWKKNDKEYLPMGWASLKFGQPK